jgi:hypothetical protein
MPNRSILSGMLMAPRTERDGMEDGARSVASLTADLLETGGSDDVLLENCHRLLSAWRSHGWYGMPGADGLRSAMSSAFPDRGYDRTFERILRSRSTGATAPVPDEMVAAAVARLRTLARLLR